MESDYQKRTMGIVILIFAVGGFFVGAMGSAGLSFTLMNDKKCPLYISIPVSGLLGLLGGILCGRVLGFWIAYNAFPSK